MHQCSALPFSMAAKMLKRRALSHLSLFFQLVFICDVIVDFFPILTFTICSISFVAPLAHHILCPQYHKVVQCACFWPCHFRKLSFFHPTFRYSFSSGSVFFARSVFCVALRFPSCGLKCCLRHFRVGNIFVLWFFSVHFL